MVPSPAAGPETAKAGGAPGPAAAASPPAKAKAKDARARSNGSQRAKPAAKSEPAQAANPAQVAAAAPASDAGRARATEPPPAPAKPAAPPDPMTRLTQEVRALGSQVLPRPADNVAGDLTAQLEVRYAAGGYINSIVVAESSGSQALDEQALGIARMTRFPNAPDELKGQDFAVRFPVVFRSGR